jgi:dTDP-4-dehydrorhamnose reductase
MAWRANVLGLYSLLHVLAGTSTRLVSLSIDLVVSGKRNGRYRETDQTDPVTVYGKTMVHAEQILFEASPDACALRISLPMGPSFNGHAGAIDWIQSRFKKSRPATLYFDEVRTPTYVDCLNRVCEELLARDAAGLFHAGGPRRLSLYQIAQIVNKAGGYDPEWLKGCRRFDAARIPPRAGDVSMISDRLAEELGYPPFRPWPDRDNLVPTHRDWHFDRPRDWPGSPAFLAETLYRPGSVTPNSLSATA